MARWVMTKRNLRCDGCGRTWMANIMAPADVAAATATPNDSQIAASNAEHFKCSCPTPQVVMEGSRCHKEIVLHRETNVGVVYVNPANPQDWQQSHSTDPNYHQNRDFERQGYVRREITGLAGIRDFIREQNNGDVYGRRGYHEALDYDYTDRKRGDVGREIDEQRVRDKAMKEAYEHIKGNSGRYERAKRDLERRRG